MKPADIIQSWEVFLKMLVRNLFFFLALSPKLPSVTGLTGGGNAKLDGYATAHLETPVKVTFKHAASSAFLDYILDDEVGAENEDVPFIIRPDDYDAGSNKKVWRLLEVRRGGTEYVYNLTTQDFHAVNLQGSGAAIQDVVQEEGVTIT